MGEAAKRIATYADIEALPPGLVGEIIDGALHTMPRPSPNNLNAQSCLLSWTVSARLDLRGPQPIDGQLRPCKNADDERVRVAPFEEAELGLSDLWAVIEDSA